MILTNETLLQNQTLAYSMFKLRADVFKHRLKWDICLDNDGLDKDYFDTQMCDYVVRTYEDKPDTVAASCRIMSMKNSTLLSTTFADSIPDDLQINDNTYECTRFCVRTNEKDAKNHLNDLIDEVKHYCKDRNIGVLLGNIDSVTLRLCKIMHWDVEIIGHTDVYSSRVFLGKFKLS